MDADFLGTQKTLPLIMKLAFPATVGMLVIALYNVVDAIFLGHSVGPAAIAALSIAFPIQLLIAAIAQAVGIGAASIVSRKLGEKKYEIASSAIGTAFACITVFSLVATLLSDILLNPMLLFFGATNDILPYAKEYVFYISFGFPLFSLFMVACGAIMSEGKIVFVTYGMILSAILNVILASIFIFYLRMGIKGAATATVVSQFCSLIYFLSFYTRRKSALSICINNFKIKLDLLGEIIFLGLPNFISMCGMSILMVIVNRALGEYGGGMAISSYSIINRLYSMIIMPIIGILQAFQPIAGYNFGAANYKRVKEVLMGGMFLSSVVAAAGFVTIMAIPKFLMSMFTSDPVLISSSARALKISVLCMLVVGVQMIGAAYFQAVGKKISSLILGLLRQVIFLIPLVIIFPRFFGIDGVWFAFPFADFFATLVTIIFLMFELKHLALKQD